MDKTFKKKKERGYNDYEIFFSFFEINFVSFIW